MAKKGKLIGIGVGPGDTELLTLKAAKVLESVPVIFSPKSAKEKKSIALSIVTPILEKRKDYEEYCYSIKRHAFHGSMRKRKRRNERSKSSGIRL